MRLVELFEKPTTQTYTETPAFKAWFRKSKAVKNGQPIMFYHGTTKEFRAFDPQYSNTQHDMPAAFFFTDKPDVAQTYAGEYTEPLQWDNDESYQVYKNMHLAGDTEKAFAYRDAHTKKNVKTWKAGAHVMPVYLRMENPLRASGKGFHWNEVEFEGEILSTKDLLYIAKERGCDSIIVKNVHDRAHGKGRPSTIVAVFSPDQIKSAMTNTGAYSGQNIDEAENMEPMVPKAGPIIVTSIPKIKFSKSDNLNPKKLKPYSWHGTTKKIAEKILSEGNKPRFSVTGNESEATFYAFQRAQTAKQDGAVLQIDNSFIDPKRIDSYYDLTGNSQYLMYKDKLPTRAFKIIKIIPYSETFKKHDDSVKKIKVELGNLLGSKLVSKYNTFPNIPVGMKSTLSKLSNDGWKMIGSRNNSLQNKTYKYYTMEKYGVFLDIHGNNKNSNIRVINPFDATERIVESMKAPANAYQDFWEQTQEVASDMEREYRSGVPTQPWKLVPAAKLVAIWKQAAKDGFVRNERGLEEIAQRMIENTQRLCINTELAACERGRTKLSLEQVISNLDIEVDDPEKFVAWAIGLPNGEVRFDCEQMRISDYGLKPLIDYAARLLAARDDKEKMTIIDLMLQVSHQRSDLASWFVEGGTATLDRLFGE